MIPTISRIAQLQKVIWNASTNDGSLYIAQQFEKDSKRWANCYIYNLKDFEGNDNEILSQEDVNESFSKEGARTIAEDNADFGYDTRVCKISRYIASESFSILEIVKVIKGKEIDNF